MVALDPIADLPVSSAETRTDVNADVVRPAFDRRRLSPTLWRCSLPSRMKLVVAAGCLMVALPFFWFGMAAVTELWLTSPYRYRLALVVSVNGTDFVAASVVEGRFTQKSPLLPQTRGVSVSFSGEAVAVDLGERGVLFATLLDVKRPFASGMWLASPENIVQSAFPRIAGEEGERGFARVLRRYAQGGEIRELRPDQLPLLVLFRDMANPISVEQVDPSNLERHFGPGAKLTRATIETVPVGWFPFNRFGLSSPRWLTGVPVTKTIDARLPWLASYRNQQLDGSRYERSEAANRLANSMNAGAFKSWQ